MSRKNTDNATLLNCWYKLMAQPHQRRTITADASVLLLLLELPGRPAGHHACLSASRHLTTHMTTPSWGAAGSQYSQSAT
jgi:hypothetical protein